MTKQKLAIKGQLRILLYMEYYDGKKLVAKGDVYGYSTSNNVKDDFELMTKKAIVNAKYRFLTYRNIKVHTNMNFVYGLKDWEIRYYQKYNIKRENINNKYYTVIRDKNNNKISSQKWTQTNEIDEPDILRPES